MLFRLRLVFLQITLSALACLAQSFSSGSNGSDGAYNPTQSGDFDPVALGLDTDGDNVFHFTTINIPSGVNIRLRAWKMRRPGPVYFLATGNVTIAGTLDLSGEDGSEGSSDLLARRLTQPGPGGYPGGPGNRPGDTTRNRGFGPGSASHPCAPVHANPTLLNGPQQGCSQTPAAYGNLYLLPLIGGSGGAGAPSSGSSTGGNGGAGGGAIRISSSTSIVVNGSILARGGSVGTGCCVCGLNLMAGTGGSIHLQSPTLSIAGTVSSQGGNFATPCGSTGFSYGRLRFDSTNYSAANASIFPTPLMGPLVSLGVPTPGPVLRFVSVGGVNAPAFPTGSFGVPDITVNSTSAIPVQIGASGIPLGTTLTLFVTSDGTVAEQTVTTSPLAGSLSSSTATANITLPQGIHRLYLRATW